MLRVSMATVNTVSDLGLGVDFMAPGPCQMLADFEYCVGASTKWEPCTAQCAVPACPAPVWSLIRPLVGRWALALPVISTGAVLEASSTQHSQLRIRGAICAHMPECWVQPRLTGTLRPLVRPQVKPAHASALALTAQVACRVMILPFLPLLWRLLPFLPAGGPQSSCQHCGAGPGGILVLTQHQNSVR